MTGDARAKQWLVLVVLTLTVAIAGGGLASWLVWNVRAPSTATVSDNSVGAGQTDQAPAAGCGAASAPVADANFVPVAGRFGPATSAYPLVVETGEIITEETARDMPGTLFPKAIPAAWDQRLYIRETSDRDADGREQTRLRLYLSPEPVGGNVLEYMEAGGVILVQSPSNGVDASFVRREIADTGRQFSLLEVGEHEAIVFLADPVIRDDLRPWHIYWSDGSRDWSLQGVADPAALIDLARSIYC
jgi:hypothetical protein